MSKQVKAIVIAGNGTNCEMETAHACRMSGADPVDIVFIWDLASGKRRIDGYDLLCLPGGFLDGDDLGSAKAGATRFLHSKPKGVPLISQIKDHISRGGLVLGICNGFQLMVKLGLLPMTRGWSDRQEATLTFNDSGRFEARWVSLAIDRDSPCIFTRGIDRLDLPVRHGEGKLVFDSAEVRSRVASGHLAPFAYADPETGAPTLTYPWNPNGSADAVAGLCDPSGRLLGLMPHPEAFWDRTNHPRWCRERLEKEGAGLLLFRNAVEYIRKHQ